MNRGKLVTAPLNDLRDRVADLSGKAFTPTHVRDNPLIFAGCAVKRTTENLDTSKTTPSTKNMKATEKKGDLEPPHRVVLNRVFLNRVGFNRAS